MSFELALLLAVQVVSATKPPEKGSVSGVVFNSVTGEPQRKVQIVAEAEGARESADPITVTDASGRFRLTQLEPGRYRIRARRNGFLETYFGARRAEARGTILRLEAGQEIKDLKIRLQPFGVITGTIRDSDGEPLPGATVSAMRFQYVKGRRESRVAARTWTDDIGQYRIANLPPGLYYVRANPNLSDSALTGSDANTLVLAPAVYPGVTDSRGATPIEIAPGSLASGIDLNLPQMQVFRVMGKVTMPREKVASASVSLFPVSSFDQELIFFNLSATPGKDGAFEIQRVPAGSYRLQAIVNSAEGSMFRSFMGRAEVAVSREDVTGIQVVAEPGVEVQAHIVVEGSGTPDVGGARLNIVGIDSARSFEFGMQNGVNVFRFEMPRGRYAVNVELPPQLGSLFLKKIQTENTDVLAEGLTIAGPSRIDVILSAEAGRLTGVVIDKAGNPLQGATVVVVPDRLRRRVDLFKDATADQNGRFEFLSVAPGDYRLFAWDDVEPGMWFGPGFLERFESNAAPVNVSAKGQPTVLVRATTDWQ